MVRSLLYGWKQNKECIIITLNRRYFEDTRNVRFEKNDALILLLFATDNLVSEADYTSGCRHNSESQKLFYSILKNTDVTIRTSRKNKSRIT